MERLSFKGTVDAVRQFSLAIAQARSRNKQQQLMAKLAGNHRSRSRCPTARADANLAPSNAAPSLSSYSTVHAAVMKEIQHRGKYRKTPEPYLSAIRVGS